MSLSVCLSACLPACTPARLSFVRFNIHPKQRDPKQSPFIYQILHSGLSNTSFQAIKYFILSNTSFHALAYYRLRPVGHTLTPNSVCKTKMTPPHLHRRVGAVLRHRHIVKHPRPPRRARGPRAPVGQARKPRQKGRKSPARRAGQPLYPLISLVNLTSIDRSSHASLIG